MVGEEVAGLISGLGISGIDASNVYPQQFPLTSADRGVSIVGYGGMASDRVFGAVVVNEYPFFHVFIRDSQDQEARCATVAQAIYLALDGYGPASLGTPPVAYRDIRSIDGPPKPLGTDVNMRPIYVLNFKATKDQS